MVEIKPAAINGFLRNPTASARLIVVAGRDRGRVKESAASLGKTWMGGTLDPLNVATFQASEWKDNPSTILQAALSPSLLGGQRLIRVMDGDKALAAVATEWLDTAHQAPEALVVIEAGDLTKADALRKLATKSDAAALLFHYADEARDVAGLIRQILTETYGFQVDNDAMSLLQQNLGGDRAVSRGELEKLALYAHGESRITADLALEIISDAAGLDMDSLCHAVSLGEFETLDLEFYRLVQAGENVNSILAVVQIHFARLIELNFHIEGGANFASASGKLRPPLFWKSKDRFQAAMGRWTSSKLELARRRLLDTITDVRTSGRPELESAQRGLFAIAAMSRAKA